MKDSPFVSNSDPNRQLQREFGERLRKLRKKAGLSADKLAEKAKLTQSRISNIEAGKGDTKSGTLYMTISDYHRLASALNVTVSELITGIEPPNETLSRETGLSDEVISRLKSLRKKGDNRLSEAVNMFFKSDGEPDSPFLMIGETLLELFRLFVLCPENDLCLKSMDMTNPAFGLTTDEVLQTKIIRQLSHYRKVYRKAEKLKDNSPDESMNNQ